jgi:hypothetical protein
MVPVAPAGETAAVRVTACNHLDGFAEEARVMFVVPLFTVCVSVAELEP